MNCKHGDGDIYPDPESDWWFHSETNSAVCKDKIHYAEPEDET